MVSRGTRDQRRVVHARLADRPRGRDRPVVVFWWCIGSGIYCNASMSAVIPETVLLSWRGEDTQGG